ncbi:PREDICTED: geranylgeranyl transferase type-1 subunit beta [Dinoponera quadriceps]|uniref:Geranylgeranyl transferase type-1 subunit beta n=1 Tax=Dinoponera quadriceps TaxID=609295 RepID=A0A6P3Y7A9_DINQU|nr:PREDICTED: geranylgeranyl transferase type-1 subunit beta [Dinoponera quadriceps]
MGSKSKAPSMTPKLATKMHVKYFQRLLQIMPSDLVEFDSTRLMIVYFAFSGLDLLNSLNEISEEAKLQAIDWIYGLQVQGAGPRSGFQASTTIPKEVAEYQCGHLAMTYTGLVTLLILGDDLSRVDRDSIIEGLRACQNPNGSFTGMVMGCESDMRFLYCACCVSKILNDWSGIDIPRATNYILQSISFDGGFGQGPGLESHGGSTFCAVASLILMGQRKLSSEQLARLSRWCLMRQDGGFQGRPGKPPDTCYSFWIGATLHLFGIRDFSDAEQNKAFILSTQDSLIGGFAKFENTRPDPLHTYLGLCGLSLLKFPGVRPINPELNMSERAYEHLKQIHEKWQSE